MSNIYWDNIVKRVTQEAAHKIANRNNGSVAAVTLRVIIDADNKPILWTVESMSVEPARSAAETIAGLCK